MFQRWRYALRDSPQASVFLAVRPLSYAVLSTLRTLPRCTRDRELTGGEAAPLDQPWRASHRSGHDDAKALLQAHRHVISRCSRRTGDAEFFAGGQDSQQIFLHGWMAGLAPQPHRHRHVPGACPDGADSPHLAQNVAYVLHPFRFFDDAHQQDIALRVQGPEVGGVVVFLRGQAPVSGGDAIAPTALPSRCKVFHPRHLGIPCRRDCGLGVLHGVQVGQHQTIHAGVQRLLDHPLVALAGVRRNPDHRHHVGLQVALFGNPFAVQQHLQGGTQGGEAKTLVFHFNNDRVVVGISDVGQVIQTAVRDRAGAENRLAVLEEVDDLVVAHLLSHVFPFQFPAWLLASPSTLRSPYCRPLAGAIHTLACQSLPTSIPCGETIARRRTEDRRVGLAPRRNGGALAAFLLPWVVYPLAADNDFIPKTGALNVYHFNVAVRTAGHYAQ